MILSLVVSLLLLVLGVIHVNWVIGGEFGLEASLPTNEDGERLLNPRKIDSALVGIGLIGFGIFYLIKSGLVTVHLPTPVLHYGGWIIPSIFFLRAIGEFKYVGFFKKVKSTKFGKLDTKLFSPLCLLLSVLGYVIQLFQ